ncbi:hypothetical protein BVY04_05200 [bacterium M21]|nr:hypothetical protein BVY04_05200 [bacterium M21]
MTVLAKIESLCRKLPEPKSYYFGAETLWQAMPTSILQFHRRRQLDATSECHNRFVLIFNMAEQGGVVIDGSMYQFRPGQALLIFPYQSHHFAKFENPHLISWLFTTFELSDQELLLPLRGKAFSLDDADLIRLMGLGQAFHGWLEEGTKSETDPAVELVRLLTGLLQKQRPSLNVAGSEGPMTAAHDFVERLSRHIYEHMDREIKTAELARLVALSPSRLRAKFKDAMGIPLGGFIRLTRIHKASGLLQSTEMSVTEIAAHCGFDSLFSFSRAFRQQVGESPQAFRKRQLG